MKKTIPRAWIRLVIFCALGLLGAFALATITVRTSAAPNGADPKIARAAPDTLYFPFLQKYPTLISTATSTATRTPTRTPTRTATPTATATTTTTAATGPLRVSTVNPRYFTDGSGKAIFLTGSHTWDNRQDLGAHTFDHTRYMTMLQQYNHNLVRFWVWEQPKGITTWPDPAEPLATLLPEIFARTGPGTAADGGLKFNLDQYNQAHFDRLRQRVLDAGNRGIYMSVMLFDGWSVEQKSGGANPWTYHPFNATNNVNGINGDPNSDQSGAEIHTLQIAAVNAKQKAYVRKVIDTINDLDNVLYEISNESSDASVAWQYDMINYIKSYQATKPKQHPVGMTVIWPNGSNTDIFNSPADWVSPNGGTNDVYKNNPPAATGNKVIVSDTDHLWGIGGDREWAWKSFTRGLNVIYMDPWDGQFIPVSANIDLRVNMGYILTYAKKINLVAMTPRGDLVSTGYALANPVAGGQYLVYLPTGGTVTVNLTGTPGTLNVEWFNPATGATTSGGTVGGGASRQLTPPFGGDAVLYIR
jgi:hypothetical protein